MEELKDIAPELSKLKKENPYGTPKNYFDDFSARMHTKIEQEKQAKPKDKPGIIQLLKPVMGLAASFAIIFMLVYVPLSKFVSDSNTTTVESTVYSNSEILNLVEGIDESTFFALIDEPDDAVEALSSDDLALYVAANFNNYEIYEIIEN
jgi:hypothetical protein